MPTDPCNLEAVHLLPVALRKRQYGLWWSAALDEGLASRGECFWPVDVCVDPDRVPLPTDSSVVDPFWRPAQHFQRFSDAALSLQAGGMLGFSGMDGFLLELHRKGSGEPLLYLGIDARLFDENLEWRNALSRDRILGSLSRSLSGNPVPVPTPEPALVGESPDLLAKGKALQALLRKR